MSVAEPGTMLSHFLKSTKKVKGRFPAKSGLAVGGSHRVVLESTGPQPGGPGNGWLQRRARCRAVTLGGARSEEQAKPKAARRKPALEGWAFCIHGAIPGEKPQILACELNPRSQDRLINL